MSAGTVDIAGMLPRVRALAWTRFRNLPESVAEPEDLVSEAMLAVVQAAGRWSPDGGASFESFATHRAFGAMLDLVRRQTFGGRHHAGEYSVLSLDAPVAYVDGEGVTLGDTIPAWDTPSDPFTLAAIDTQISRLSPRVQATFWLTVTEDLSRPDAAEILGISVAGVDQHIRTFRAAIAAHPVVASELVAA